MGESTIENKKEINSKMRVLVIGGGIGGLTLGIALGQRGIIPDIIESRDESAVLGVGISLTGNAMRVFEKLGLLQTCLNTCFPFEGYNHYDINANLITHKVSKLSSPGVPSKGGISRRALYLMLLKAAQDAKSKIRFHTTVKEMTDHGTHVSVTTTNGISKDYDLVVGFDGIRSDTRRRVFGEQYEKAQYTGYGVFRFMSDRPKNLTCGEVYFGDTCKIGIVPTDEKSMYLFTVVPMPSNTWIDSSECPARLTEILKGFKGFVAELRERLKNESNIVYSPIEEVRLPTWYKGRIVLCGDAAHSSPPHLGQGAAMAIEDAYVLAESLDGNNNISEVLDKFMKRRGPRCLQVQNQSRALLEAEAAAVLKNNASEASSSNIQLSDIELMLCEPA